MGDVIPEQVILTKRQRRCAESEQGHEFPFDRPYGVCVHCLLRVNPPKDEHPSQGA